MPDNKNIINFFENHFPDATITSACASMLEELNDIAHYADVAHFAELLDAINSDLGDTPLDETYADDDEEDE